MIEGLIILAVISFTSIREKQYEDHKKEQYIKELMEDGAPARDPSGKRVVRIIKGKRK